MEVFQGIGKTLIAIGLLIVAVGLIILAAEKVNFPFVGKLPGDIYVKRNNFQLYFPVVTSILLSLILSVVLYLVSHFFKR